MTKFIHEIISAAGQSRKGSGIPHTALHESFIVASNTKNKPLK